MTITKGSTDAYKGMTTHHSFLRSLPIIGDKPSLLSYDLYNEPGLNISKTPPLTRQKQKVCEYVSMWYDSIMTIDPNHLITLGGAYPDDAMYWDDYIMKVDFVSMHPYPSEQVFENYDPVKATNRVLDAIYWCSNTLQRPWIIGETGFTAAPDACLFPPWTQGSLTDQYNYVAAVLPAARDCGATFPWGLWMGTMAASFRCLFVTVTTIVLCDTCSIAHIDTGAIFGNYYGLLEYSDPDSITHLYDTLFDSHGLQLFQTFNPFLTGGTCAAPTAQYYNPYLFPANPVNSVTGLVQDQNGNTIANALVDFWYDYEDKKFPYEWNRIPNTVYTSANTSQLYLYSL